MRVIQRYKMEGKMVKFMGKAMFIVVAVLIPGVCWAGVFGPSDITPESKKCIDCHKKETPVINQQWGASKHYRGKIGCYECHQAKSEEEDAFDHYGEFISVIVSPKDCARCHEKEVSEFNSSHHSKGGADIRITG